MDFLLCIFNLFRSLHSVSSVWKISSTIHKMGKTFDSPASFRSISLAFCVSKLFERFILLHLLFFLESNSILSPLQAGFHPGRSTLDLSQFNSDRCNKPRPGSRMTLATIDFSRAFESVWQPLLFTNLFRLASLLPLLVGLNLSFLIGALAWFFKITKVAAFESVEVLRKNPFLVLFSSLFSSMIFLLLCLPSAALFMLTIWPFGPSFLWSLLR